MKNTLDKRQTFAIISHPDAGKTTFTEQLLLISGSINLAGTIKAKKSARHATSDWMELEKQRGISVSTSVMQLQYKDAKINLLDTPGHADFSEDTYRTLTAVDSALMVIDVAKGVESRTIKLMEICRMRSIPIFTFINKLDREGRDFFELLDEIEKVLSIGCVPIIWPLGSGRHFRGIYNLIENNFHLYKSKHQKQDENEGLVIDDVNYNKLFTLFGDEVDQFFHEIEVVKQVLPSFDKNKFLTGEITPVYFGSAIHCFGIDLFLDDFIKYAPNPQPRVALERKVNCEESKFTGFVFKIQANMDPKHHDRIAFLRIVSGAYNSGMKLFQVRTKKDLLIKNALNIFANEREVAEDGYPGDVIGIHNYGTIRIGDTFTQGEVLHFQGIPNFAPELFRIVFLKNPLKSKALLKGLQQLCEEGATQVFKLMDSNDIILGAVGVLQFDVVAFRLNSEYSVDCIYKEAKVAAVRWVSCEDHKIFEEFKYKIRPYLAYDGDEQLAYLAPSMVHLNLMKEKWPQINFSQMREQVIVE